MVEVAQRLAACTDALAVATELRTILSDLATTHDRRAALNEVVAFLAASEEHWTVATKSLFADLSGDLSAREVQLELLDALLVWATQESTGGNHKVLTILFQCFQLAVTGLGDAGGGKRWLKWGDEVLTAVHQNAALIEQQKSVEGKNEADRGWRSYLMNVAALLLQLRNKLEADDDATPDLKTVTFVWKNLAKLATIFGPILASSSPGPEFGETAEGSDDGKYTMKFDVDELMAAAALSVERSAGRLLRVLDTTEIPDLGVLKFLKLHWRAFQRLITAFADSLECELESSVLVMVNVTASLLYALRHSLLPKTSKPEQELRDMLEQGLELTEKLAGGGVNDLAKQSICTLLWHPASEMVRAVKQRQPAEITNVDVEKSIQWGHLLVLTAFAGFGGGSSSSAEVPYDDSVRAVEVSQLFARYRECALSDAVSRSLEATKLFTDLMLEFFLGFDSVVELQLVLLKQTLYPDWTQRTLCWEIWRELLCFSWDETLAGQTLQLLLDITQWDDDSGASFVLASGVGDEILQLIAFVYADLPVSLKDVCMDQVTAIIDVVSSEGPGHQFNLRVASQLHLLEKLVAVQFLKLYDGPMKDEWIAKYLPMCFECCGTVLELLSAEGKTPLAKHEDILGMMRVLDMCLMVLRGVFDDNEPKQDDIAELSVILVRMSTEALTQLAMHMKHTGSSQSDVLPGSKRTSRSERLEKTGSSCFGRAIETSLYLLSKLGPVLKANRSNQCVQVMKDLRTITDNTQVGDTLIVTAQFIGASLFDVQVASGDIPIVTQLLFSLFQKLFAAAPRTGGRQLAPLTLLLSVGLDALYELLAHSNIVEQSGAALSTLLAGDLKQSFVQSVSMRRLSPDDVAKALETAQSSTLQSLKRNQSSGYRVFRGRFPDESSELAATTFSNKRSAEDSSESLPQKRHKLDHFVSLCREIESSLASIESDEAAANILSGKELEDATAVLHKLLTKTITLC
ncbi:hypothetical protein PInf_021076 [Phytophthora infestans]|nr:hypothetical protein PInf_021076 [Phytophthora infestans]